MSSKSTVAKMSRRDLWFMVMLVFFFANTLVMLFCHHIVMHHDNKIRATGSSEINAVSDMLSQFLEAGSSGSIRGGQDTVGDGDDEAELPVFAICLLTRDDLPILPEWIAYHYHAVKLRHLVMAVDPLSASDPKDILDNFRKELPDLTIEEWSEADFMPDYFVRGEYGKAPNFVGGHGNPDTNTWEGWYSKQKNFFPKKVADQTLVNSHRYRQTRFLSRCSEHLRDTYAKQNEAAKSKTPVWMSTLDSDEYLSVNPWMLVMKDIPSVDESILRLEPGAVLKWVVDWRATKKQRQQHRNATTTTSTTEDGDVCLQIPRLLFGAVELSPDTTSAEELAADTTHSLVQKDGGGGKQVVEFVDNLPRHSNKMETLRWKFHASPDDERNFQQKVILDLFNIAPDDELWGDHVHTVHRPSRKLCAPESNDNTGGTLLVPTPDAPREASPLVGFHYIGSFERYFSRPNDFRRNKKRYRERSNITDARDETGWIDQWFERFVHDVGVETATALLSSYIVKENEIAT